MFIPEEIEVKKAQIRKLLDTLGLDAILIKKTSNFAWMTGGAINYVAIVSEVGVCTLLITRDKTWVISNNIEHPRLCDEEHMEDMGYTAVSYPWHHDAGEQETVTRLMGEHAILGSDYGYPGAKDINPQINPLRWALTDWEVERYSQLGRASALAVEETALQVRPGDKECEVAGRLLSRLLEERIDHVVVLCAADDRIAKYRHPLTTDRRIVKRAFLTVNARRHGLIISTTRMINFGPTAPDIRRRYMDNVYISSCFMAHSLPGNPLRLPFEKGVAAYAERGYDAEQELHHQGGPTGYNGRDNKVHWKTQGTIAPNQAFAWNPTVTGCKTEDVMLATRRGPVVISGPVLYPTLETDVGGFHFIHPDIAEL